MTTKLINYFKIKAKYDKQTHNYYIDNLKTIFEHYYYYNDDNEFVDNPKADFYINLSISEYKSKYERAEKFCIKILRQIFLRRSC